MEVTLYTANDNVNVKKFTQKKNRYEVYDEGNIESLLR